MEFYFDLQFLLLDTDAVIALLVTSSKYCKLFFRPVFWRGDLLVRVTFGSGLGYEALSVFYSAAVFSNTSS